MIGVVVIGRNEGPKLIRCLLSVLACNVPIVYADSDSSDDSANAAEHLGVSAVRLDPSLRMTASRGRKEGFDCLINLHPAVEFVLFLDGDCVLDKTFIPAALTVFEERPDACVVFGRLRELHPEQSVYNRIADLEWNRAVGEVASCGGNAMFRVEGYLRAGGYDDAIAAGEEPELCSRIVRLGQKVICIDSPMGFHDLGFTRLGQWWVRGLRGGFGALDVKTRFRLHYFDRQLLSARIWSVWWPFCSAALIFFFFVFAGQRPALWIAFVACSLMPLQVIRIAYKGWSRGLGPVDSLAYGGLMMLNKWASFAGQLQWLYRERFHLWSSTQRDYWTQDLHRYPKRPFLKEQSIWAIAVHRWGAAVYSKPDGWPKKIEFQLYWLCFRLVETLTGISLPHNARIGPGLRIHHFGGIFVNPQTVIGANCTLRQGVTLGNRYEGGGAPTVGSNVDFGAYSQVLGSVCIGDNAKVGAMTVVLDDVPANSTVVGNPARVVRIHNVAGYMPEDKV